jgi:hypothetical protein
MQLKPGKEVKPLIYEEIVIGEELPVLEITPEEDLQGRYLIALEDDNPWYYKESPFGGPIVHHALLDGSPMVAAMQKYEFPFAWVHAKQDTEFINPAPLGKPLCVHSKIIDKYIRRGREYVVIESLIVDQEGVEIMKVRLYGMIGDERIREAAKTGLRHIPPPPSQQF